jgi:hypothetical protein
VTLDEFRQKMESWWQETDARELALKNSQGALLELMALYKGLNSAEQTLADRVFAEWLASGNNRKKFDALAAIDQFQIRSAVPQLRILESEITKRQDHEAPYELAKVRRMLERLSSQRH